MDLELTLNGRRQRRDVQPWTTLLEALRDGFGLKGTKGYCYSGICGACTVLVNGEPVSSCIMPAPHAQGREITTVEGLEHDGELHPIQRAFVEHFGLQCGYCTPGMLLMARALLEQTPEPTPRGDHRVHGREHLPLHGLRPHHRVGGGGVGAAAGRRGMTGAGGGSIVHMRSARGLLG